ncbi:MAG: FAD-dependent oxidoreductase [Anaerolineaceae bacterium]|nr:FAD-dependent oxidoreductase [Anaerolineaceae bacterium]
MADYDLLVIGGGAGGLNVASAAAQLGATVALVEKRRLGGDCLWHGCVPSKALIRCAAAAHNLREIDHFGVRVYGLQTDFPQAMKYVHDVQARIAEHDDPERFRNLFRRRALRRRPHLRA